MPPPESPKRREVREEIPQTPSEQRVEHVRQAIARQDPETRRHIEERLARYTSSEAFVAFLAREIRVGDFPVSFEGARQGVPPLRDYLHKNAKDVPPSRYPIFERNLRSASANLASALRERYPTAQGVQVVADGPCLVASLPDGDRVLATALGTFLQPKEYASTYIRAGGRAERNPNAHRFYILHPGEGDPKKEGNFVLRDMEHKDAVNHDVFVHSGHTDLLRRDGSIAVRATGEKRAPNIRYYNGDDNERPSLMYIQELGKGGSVQSEVASRVGSADRVRYTFNAKGLYVLGPEGGEPVGAYEQPRERLTQEQRTERIHAHAERVAKNLRTPEAIGAYVATIFTREYRNVDAENRSVRWKSDGAVQDVQHPYKTIERGAGDCEDFALLAKELLLLAGIPSVVMLQSPIHYICAFLEKNVDGTYTLCYIDVSGFNRVEGPKNPDGSRGMFRSAEEAMRYPWKSEGGSGAQYLLSVRPEYAPHYSDEVKRSGGIVELRMPEGIDDSSERFSKPIPFRGTDWSVITVER